ncbi:MAG TPA: [FeFe] hydrogenase, group A [Candidatus Krumholzibacteria bacterium]|nr:[FeFe] hydrogenase, group A [Candidatus Krumholzibacteria bacterium]HRX52451.1 [FeFe] hydrogenase, group A [Candidatus Krumholzibacteria bacterium]
MVTIEVNGRTVRARAGEMLLGVLRREGVRIPTLCQMDGLEPTGSCRLCAVEVEGRPTLVTSCAAPVEAGMVVRTHSARAVAARRTLVELLLNNHPDDCLYCPRHGDCRLQDLAEELGVRSRRLHGSHTRRARDVSSPAIVRDPEKCVLCGKCVRVCGEIQGVAAIDLTGRGCLARVDTAFGEGLNVSSCINCGQCVMVCPTGALTEHSHIDLVENALGDPELTVVVQCAPSISVTLAELCGELPGQDVDAAMTGLLRRLGFAKVFDTGFSADLTVMEEASELVRRLREGGTLPMFTSCSPGWVKFVETFYPHRIGHLSTCKSPQQMLGAVIKSRWAAQAGVDPHRIFSVAVMPCTAKKFEAARPEMLRGDLNDVDAVLTTRELASLMRRRGLRLGDAPAEHADLPFGTRSGAGKIFGASGGVMEAAVRTAHKLLTGEDPPVLELAGLRGRAGIREMRLAAGGLELGLAVVNGLGHARRLLDEIEAGRDDLHFIEVMTCPGGCLAGGGQPFGAASDAVGARLAALYRVDGRETLRTAHANPAVQELYAEFLGEPLSARSHELLHTRYVERTVLR